MITKIPLKHTVWKNKKFTITEKIFRQINYSAVSLVKPLLSRNFCQKSVTAINFRNFHTVKQLFHSELNLTGNFEFKIDFTKYLSKFCNGGRNLKRKSFDHICRIKFRFQIPHTHLTSS